MSSKSLIRNPDSDGLQVATLWLGEMLLGIDIRCIREIIRVGTITPVPAAPASVRGVINLRGDVVTVMDLRSILALPSEEPTVNSRLMIVQSNDERIGLLVDRVTDVVTTDPTQREPLPANLDAVQGRLFYCIYKLDQGILVTLNVDAALGEAA